MSYQCNCGRIYVDSLQRLLCICKTSINEAIWICPKCKHEQSEQSEKKIWCGKNLLCPSCKEYSYYDEWTDKN